MEGRGGRERWEGEVEGEVGGRRKEGVDRVRDGDLHDYKGRCEE